LLKLKEQEDMNCEREITTLDLWSTLPPLPTWPPLAPQDIAILWFSGLIWTC